jgi:hypothetical protein
MIRAFAFTAVALFANTGLCEVFNLAGQITNGVIFVPAEAGNLNSYFIVENFPIDYTAKFSIDPAGQVAGFTFVATYATSPMEHTAAANLYPGIVRNDSEQLLVNFDNGFGAGFRTHFDLKLNKASGEGEWEYDHYCPVCDGVFTTFNMVEATITSFSVVPEPYTGLIAMVLAAGALARRPTRARN